MYVCMYVYTHIIASISMMFKQHINLTLPCTHTYTIYTYVCIVEPYAALDRDQRTFATCWPRFLALLNCKLETL